MPKTPFLAACEKTIGTDAVLKDPQLMLPYLTDVRKRFTGKAMAVLFPKSTQEVSLLMGLCTQYRVNVVPQGGNTGTVLGSVPDKTGHAVVISLKRMNHILGVDPENLTMTVEAGCILDHVRAAARDAGRLFPLSLASSGSCMIGGNLAANAGGTAVLRYGTARDLCLGLQAVLPDGAVYDGLYRLRKNNTGYDLKDLFIGSEGTLGIITAAVLKLFPLPKGRQTAFVA
ncbi:MAG: FAD-binding oxidoreductase, partial [Oxalobacter sp.]|nr:FAD-binding oxidoreductase [Oxalobacter sp.]